jgi:hypothetical protein
MAVYSYTYWGTATGTVNIGQQYKIDGVVQFQIVSATNTPIPGGLYRCFFEATGTILPSTVYNETVFGITLTTGAYNTALVLSTVCTRYTGGNYYAFEVASGIGNFQTSVGSNSYYEYSSGIPFVGTLTPSREGYSFTPASMNFNISSASLVSPDRFVATISTSYVNITGTISGTSSLSGVLTVGSRLKPPSATYWYDSGEGTAFYYRLWIMPDGSYGDPPPTGTENIDYEVLAGYEPNFINTNRRLIAIAKNSLYYESI